MNSAGNLVRDLREAGEYSRSIDVLRARRRGGKWERSRRARPLNARHESCISSHGRPGGRGQWTAGAAYQGLNENFGTANPDTLKLRAQRARQSSRAGDIGPGTGRELGSVQHCTRQASAPRIR